MFNILFGIIFGEYGKLSYRMGEWILHMVT